jgi:hypothetical protein
MFNFVRHTVILTINRTRNWPKQRVRLRGQTQAEESDVSPAKSGRLGANNALVRFTTDLFLNISLLPE